MTTTVPNGAVDAERMTLVKAFHPEHHASLLEWLRSFTDPDYAEEVKVRRGVVSVLLHGPGFGRPMLTRSGRLRREWRKYDDAPLPPAEAWAWAIRPTIALEPSS